MIGSAAPVYVLLLDDQVPLQNVGFSLSPSCKCCTKCILGSDDFDRGDSTDLGGDWTELAGDWSIAGNQLSITSTAAAASFDAVERQNPAVVCDITAGDDGDKARVCIRMADEDNYLCAEVEFGASSSTLRLFTRSGGSDSSAHDSDNTSDVTTGDTVQLTVCAASNELSGVLADATGKRLAVVTYSAATVPGLLAGVATGDALVSSIVFDDFLVMTRSCVVCGLCEPLPVEDDFSTAEPNWTLTRAAISGGVLQIPATGSDGSAVRCAETPTGDGWILTFEATLALFDPDFAEFNVGFLEHDIEFSITGSGPGPYNYEWIAGVDSDVLSTEAASGDVLKIVVSKSGSTIDIDYYINGALEHSETAFPDPFSGPTFQFGFTAVNFIAPAIEFDDLTLTIGP